MLKKFGFPILFAVLAVCLLYYAYSHRSVSAFLWSISFLLLAWVVLTSFLRGILVSVISITVTLAIVEAALGFFPQLMAKKAVEASSPTAYFDTNFSYSTPAYWQLGSFGSQPKPGIFESRKVASDGSTVYTASYTIGLDGFRETPQYGWTPQDSLKSARPRINFLGDSFTFGEGLNDNQTMEYFFGDLSQKQGQAIWVKNYGVHGWGMHQSLAILQSDLDSKANLQFALTSPWHASRSACADFYSLGSPRYLLQDDGLVKRSGYCRSFGWVEHSPKPIRGLITSSKIFNLIVDSLFVISDQDQQIKLYLGILKTMQQNLALKDQKFILGFVKADQSWFVGTYNNDKLIGAIKAMGIDVVDMTLASTNEALEKKYYIHELDKHPSAAGNEARSKILLNYWKR
jgi:hypothetical protein